MIHEIYYYFHNSGVVMDVPRLDIETVSTAEKNIERARLDGIIPQTRRTPTATYNRVAGKQETKNGRCLT